MKKAKLMISAFVSILAISLCSCGTSGGGSSNNPEDPKDNNNYYTVTWKNYDDTF